MTVIKCPKCGLETENPVDDFEDHPYPSVVVHCRGGRLYPSEEAAKRGDGPYRLMPVTYLCERCWTTWSVPYVDDAAPPKEAP